MLAATSIGAIWSSCSPDFGIKGVLDRFGQIEPKILFTADGYYYKDRIFDSLERISRIIKDLRSIEKIVVVPYTDANPDISQLPNSVIFSDFLSQEKNLEIDFEQLPFGHPLYIMYSSGTTGVPKCIVHGAGGTLIQHLKELMLHTDLKREDNIFYFTTCGWMMWNWLVTSLAVGATVLLFDGNPFYPDPYALFDFAREQGMTVFGTSAKYIESLENAGMKLSPDQIPTIRTICSTGELQCRGLGMRVEAFDDAGNSVVERKGELVCTAPFPSMPIYFWNDPENSKYKAAYFERYPGVWHHGDYILITREGGVVIYGRSDATLNPGGVRIGTAEIYRVVENMVEVEDSIVVGQDWEKDMRIILFVKLNEGIRLDDELMDKIKRNIREKTTPRHVPAKILTVNDIPYTINGKKVELAVKKIIHNQISFSTRRITFPAPRSLKEPIGCRFSSLR